MVFFISSLWQQLDDKLVRIGATIEAEMESEEGKKEWLSGVVIVILSLSANIRACTCLAGIMITCTHLAENHAARAAV